MSAPKVWEIEVPEKGKGGGEDYVLPPEGNHPAVCIAVIDLGTQRERKFNSDELEEKRMVYLVWELVDVEGNPLVGRHFKASLHEKSGLRHFVDAWQGARKDREKFNVFALTGKTCLLNIKHGESKTGRTYARIEGATPLPKVNGKPWEMPAPKHDPVALTIAEHAELPAWVPYLIGRPVKSWLAGAQELRRTAPRAAGAAPDVSGDEYVPDEEQEPQDSIPY